MRVAVTFGLVVALLGVLTTGYAIWLSFQAIRRAYVRRHRGTEQFYVNGVPTSIESFDLRFEP